MKEGLDMAKYDAIFIGAGNSNLTCALRLVKSGKKVLILEKNNVPGGVATSFIRGRFEFDASLQELMEVGTEENPGVLYKLFQDLKIADQIRFFHVPTCYHIYVKNTDQEYVFPFGIRNFIDKMEEYVPKSRESVETFFHLALECRNALKYIEKKQANIRYEVLLNDYPQFIKIANSSVEEVLNAIEMPKKAQEILTAFWMYFASPIHTLSFVHFASVFYEYIATEIVIPKKRSHEISLTLAEEILKNGGRIQYLSPVQSILMENGQAIGVQLENEEKFYGNIIVSGVAPSLVYSQMIPKEYVPQKALQLINSRILGGRGFSIYLGLNQNANEIGLADYQYIIMDSLDSKREYENMNQITHSNIRVTVLNNANPSCSPKGTCILQFTSFFSGDGFDKIVTEENYFQLKEQIAKRMIESFENATDILIMPYIEEIEIATPVTFARYGNYLDGSIFGYKVTGLDNILPRLFNEANEIYIEHLQFSGSYGPNACGYAATYLAGDQLANRILSLEEGGKEHE